MAIKRKMTEKETEAALEIDKKKKKRTTMADRDRLSDLPEALQLRILSSLNTKQAVQTSVLSRTWVSLWSVMPVLEFNYFDFKKRTVFDKFVNNVLFHRHRSAKLDILKYSRIGLSSNKSLKTLFDCAFSHGVKQLEVDVQHSRNNIWPVCPRGSFDSLTSLKLESLDYFGCPFLEPGSISFKNLTVLHLRHAIITDLESFSGFSVLESLTLVNCYIWPKGESETKTLSVNALRLTDLTISSCYESINCCQLTTPRLRFLEYRGSEFPLLEAHGGLPVLERVVMDFKGYCYRRQEKQMFDDLLSMFSTLHNVKSLTLFSSIVHFLSLFPDELLRRNSAFRDLKDLKMDFTNLYCQYLFESRRTWSFDEVPFQVKDYLLQNSPHAKFTFTCPESL